LLDGAGFAEVWPHLAVLATLTLVFLSLAAVGFKWRVD
jgi:hypothetical protein